MKVSLRVSTHLFLHSRFVSPVFKMKFIIFSLLAVQQVAGHALFQQLWVNGVDKKDTCVRMPRSNSPVSLSSNDVRCNAGGAKGVAGKCEVPAGSTITVEMHQVRDDLQRLQ